MAVVDHTARLAIRAVIIVLMTLVAAVPALAESGCFESTGARSVTTIAAATSSISSADHSDDDGKTSLGGGVHCAFSHCAHSVPAAPPEQNASQSNYPAIVYGRPVAHRLLDASTDGPDHPPRA